MFALVVIIVDFVKGNECTCSCHKNEEKPCCEAPQTEEVVEETQEEVVEEVKEETQEEVVEEVKEEVVATPLGEDSVQFQHASSKTLEQKYSELTEEAKTFYDEIVKYAAVVEGVKSFKNTRYEDFKIGYSKVVRLTIKKGVVICEFVFQNYDFKYYIKGNKVAVKQAPVTMRIVDDVALAAAKGSIDIAVKAIQEEKAYKKQLAKAKRQQAKVNN